MKGKVLVGGAVFLVFAVMSLLGQRASSRGPEGATLKGSRYWKTVMGPGLAIPCVLVFHTDGTCVASGGISFGGVPTNPYRYTPFQGVWVRTNSHKFTATLYSLRFDGASGLLVGVARKRVQFWFAGDSDHFAGTMSLDVLPCASPLTCPDPLTASDSAWQPFNPPPSPSEFSIHADRIGVVPYQ